MGSFGRSRTAQGVLAERAILTDMGVLSDRFAAAMLTPSTDLVVALVRRLPYRMRAQSVTLAGLAARVTWFDVQVTNALDKEIEQVVVIGAGYDGRAWRFGRPGVQFFELDHAGTQRDKRRRAPGPGPTYIEADVTEQSAGEALVGGLDESRLAVFVIEGVSMYLNEEVLRHQLLDLRRVAAIGSRLAVPAAIAEHRAISDKCAFSALRASAAGKASPWLLTATRRLAWSRIAAGR